MQILTAAARLSQGQYAFADSEPELATVPDRLRVRSGLDPNSWTRAEGAAPLRLQPLPASDVDASRTPAPADVFLMIVEADDPLTVAHAIRVLEKDTRSFGAVRWTSAGCPGAPGSEIGTSVIESIHLLWR